MNLIRLEFGEQKKKPTGKQLRAKYVENSRVDVVFSGFVEDPTQVHIEFHGELARIPSLKNSRHPKFPGVNPDVQARLDAMTQLYHAETRGGGPSWPPGTKVAGILLCADRSRSFDVDNCATTIKDWLEPHSKIVGTKNKRARGWGAGVVDDDKHVRILPFLQSDIVGAPREHTTLILKPWRSVRMFTVDYLASAFMI